MIKNSRLVITTPSKKKDKIRKNKRKDKELLLLNLQKRNTKKKEEKVRKKQFLSTVKNLMTSWNSMEKWLTSPSKLSFKNSTKFQEIFSSLTTISKPKTASYSGVPKKMTFSVKVEYKLSSSENTEETQLMFERNTSELLDYRYHSLFY